MSHSITIDAIRRDFHTSDALFDNLPDNPFLLFSEWLLKALESDLHDPTACVLATVDEKYLPDTRVVLLKEYSEEGFVFYTNYSSRKAQQLTRHPSGALNFYWPSLMHQIRLRGSVTKISAEKSARYFQGRPRDSQLAAYASKQSTVTTNEALHTSFEYYQQFFKNENHIPYPPFWGGYLLQPCEFEFWQGKPNRLHFRVYYTQQDNLWKKEMLAP